MEFSRSQKYFLKKEERGVLFWVIEALALTSSVIFAFYLKNPFLIGVIFLIANFFASSLFSPQGALIVGLINGILTSILFLFYLFVEQRFLAIAPWISILPLFFPLFLFISYFIGLSGAQKEKLKKEVEEKTRELKEAKDLLEIKVRLRTRELEDLNKKLENEVEERTKEFQKKVDELERFQKLVVGRELKMMKMKSEIEKLKEELRKYKKF